MNKRPHSLALVLWALALPIVLACGGDGDGGGPDAALGDQMSALAELGDQFVGQNQETYDGLAQAAGFIGTLFQNPGVTAALENKQEGCLPEGLEGSTFAFDVATQTFILTDPRGPSDALQLVLFDPTETEVGFVNVTCAGAFPSLSVTVSVNTVDQVEVLSLLASNVSASPPATFSASLSGRLRSADGQEEVPFGVGSEGNFLELSEFGKFGALGFQVSETAIASVAQSVSTVERIDISVQDSPAPDPQAVCPARFDYQGAMQGTPGNLLGDGIFCARPPLGDDLNRFVNCFAGSIENMTVSEAELSCQTDIFVGSPTTVSGAVLNTIQDGTNGLFGMFTTVITVAEAGGAIAIEIVANQPQL